MQRASRRPILLATLALLLCGAATQAAAVEPLDTFNVRIGGYGNRFDTNLRADGTTGTGTDIDLHQDLGLDQDNTIAFVGMNWRPFDHHEFGLAYYNDDSSASRKLQRDIDFNGTLYQTNSTVRAKYKLDAYELNYVWWAASHERWALGPRVGLIWYKLKLGLDMELDASGNPASNAISGTADANLPSPSIGASWRWTPARDWRVSADVGYFKANINDVDGDVTYGRLGLEWYPWQRVGFLLDYTANRIDASVQQSELTGKVRLDDSGVRVGIAYRF